MRTKEIIAVLLLLFGGTALANNMAPKPWDNPEVSQDLSKNVLYLPIAAAEVKAIPISDSKEKLIDLLKLDNPRIRPLESINKDLCTAYSGYSQVRFGLYQHLLRMLDYLPQDTGIAFCEGFRPIAKQKEYFDLKFQELLLKLENKEKAYTEASKFVSPFIDNIPTHCTGAAIDITLFIKKDNNTYELLDMGNFGTIGYDPKESFLFSPNITLPERENRLLLLNAATKAGLASYGYEWWHYSYGDKMWAYVKGKKNALYGLSITKDDPILRITKDKYFKDFRQ